MSSAATVDTNKDSSEAYVTLLYGEHFLAGARVLGRSLQESGTTRDRVILVAGNVSEYTIATLTRDGWKVHLVDIIHNPGTWMQNSANKQEQKNFPARFYAVYTKLLAFNLTQYQRIVYIDADCVLLRNVDELFLCDGFCSVMRHSEHLNSGVMVITPSNELFNIMIQHIADTPSYTGGDQGFLNEFFAEYKAAPFFDPEKEGLKLSEAYPDWKDKRGMRIGRLPTTYNADIGLFVFNSGKWVVSENKLGVLHYTLGAFKPWDWWAPWLLGSSVVYWQDIRKQLPGDALGYVGGQNAQQRAAIWISLPLPWIIALVCLRKYCAAVKRTSHHKNKKQLIPTITSNHGGGDYIYTTPRRCFLVSSCSLNQKLFSQPPVPVPYGLGALSSIAGLLSVLIGLYTSTQFIVPAGIVPVYGWVIMYEWTAFVASALFGVYLRVVCYDWEVRKKTAGWFFNKNQQWGQLMEKKASSGASTLNNSWPLKETLLLFTSIFIALVSLPFWTDLLGIYSFTWKVVGTSIAGAGTLAFIGQAFSLLGVVCLLGGAAFTVTPSAVKIPRGYQKVERHATFRKYLQRKVDDGGVNGILPVYSYDDLKKYGQPYKTARKPLKPIYKALLALFLLACVALLVVALLLLYYYYSIIWEPPVKPIAVDGTTSKFTMVTMSHPARISTLKKVVRHYSRCPSVNEIVIVWSNGPPPPHSDFNSLVPVRLREETSNSLNNRFKPDSSIATDGVLQIDDDTLIWCSDIERAFAEWRRHPSALVGFIPRLITNVTAPGSSSSSGWLPSSSRSRTQLKYHMERAAYTEGRYNALLTVAEFMPKEAMEWYWKDDVAPARAFVDQYFNCEDILMNFVVANNIQQRFSSSMGRSTHNIEVRSPQAVWYIRPHRRLDISGMSHTGISRKTHHITTREKCAEKFIELYGGNILTEAEFQWDSVDKKPFCWFFGTGCVYL